MSDSPAEKGVHWDESVPEEEKPYSADAEEDVDDGDIDERVQQVAQRFGGLPGSMMGAAMAEKREEASSAEAAGDSSASAAAGGNDSLAVLVVGMAGSGKTTLVQRMLAELHMRGRRYYSVNLDPAVNELPYTPHVDIRKTVKYKDVMKQYGLGPNGAILTSLNLFATRADQIVQLFETRHDSNTLGTAMVDTPGQIEVFTWSASGSILTEAIATVTPTCILFVVDSLRAKSPATYMSSMLYACSVLYRTRLPIVLAFNKSDVADTEILLEWMQDFDVFLDALAADTKAGMMGSLVHSMTLALAEFYEGLRAVPVSAATGEGVDALLKALDSAREEYNADYLPIIQAARAKRAAQEEEKIKKVSEAMKDSDDEESPLKHVEKDSSFLGPNIYDAPTFGVTANGRRIPTKDEEDEEDDEEEEEGTREKEMADRLRKLHETMTN